MFSELSSVGNIVAHKKSHKKQPSFKELLYATSASTSPLFDYDSEEIRKSFDKFINSTEVKHFKNFVERNKGISEMASHSSSWKFLRQFHIENFLLSNRKCKEGFTFGIIGETSNAGKLFLTRMKGCFETNPTDQLDSVQVEMKYMEMKTTLSIVDLSMNQPWNQNLSTLHSQYSTLSSKEQHGIALLMVDTCQFNQKFILEQFLAITRDFHNNQPKSPIILLGINTKKRHDILTQSITNLESDNNSGGFTIPPLSREQGEKIGEKIGCFTYLEADIDTPLGLEQCKQLLFKTLLILEELKTH